MNINERINERANSIILGIQNSEEQKILESQRTLEREKQLLNDIKLEEFLKEIKDNVWETGEVKTQEGTGFYKELSINLTAKWPKFKPKHRETAPNGDDYDVNPSIQLNGQSINIKINLKDTTIELNEETSNFKYRNDPKIIYYSTCNSDEEYKNKIEEEILKFCVEEKLKGKYPLTLEIQKDRQEIIQKINSGELLMKNVANDFFSEDEMKFINPPQTKTEIPQKRSFLDKLFG